jgi:catechol 2,3-dioxygenase-like lactoylglutathione lyase family enzyme
MSIRYSHTNLIARNWKTITDFYIKVFDCKPTYATHLSGEYLEKGTGLKNINLEGTNLLLPGYENNRLKLEIFQYSELLEKVLPITPNRLGYGHIAFLVDNIEKILQKALANGAKKIGEIVTKEYPKGITSYIYISDPEGNIVEIQKWLPK